MLISMVNTDLEVFWSGIIYGSDFLCLQFYKDCLFIVGPTRGVRELRNSQFVTTVHRAGDSSSPVALLLVHGVGSQKRGETLNGLLSGLRLAFGDRLGIRRTAEDHAVLEGVGRPVHIFEVYWADLLHGDIVKRTFDPERIMEVAWFPLLNHRSGRLTTQICPRGRVLRWTAALAPLSFLIHAGFWGAKFLVSFPSGLLQALRESKVRPAVRAKTRGFIEMYRANRDNPDVGRTIIDELMDQVAGDVFNYVHGVAEAFPEDNAQNQQLTNNVDEIHVRFLRAAERAVEQGCSEIQVLAHSLGTVVAFLAMCPQTYPSQVTRDPANLTHFYTIGSPLEKIRFFWTRLLEHSPNGPVIAIHDRLVAADSAHGGTSVLQWDNFFSYFDLVSGRLREFVGWPAPTNHPARGLGGLITAHVAYNRNPDFLALLAEGLTGKRSEFRLSLLRRVALRIVSTLESLLLPAAFLVLAITGLVFMGGIAWLSGWLFTQPLEWFGLGSVAQGIRIYFVASMIFMMTIGGILVGYWRAQKLYARFWHKIKPNDY